MSSDLGVWTADDCALVPLAGPALETIHWYWREVPQVSPDVGIAEAEKAAAAEGVPA